MASTDHSISGGALRALQLVEAHTKRMKSGIQLYAGSCMLSPTVERALVNNMGLMPAMGDSYSKQQPGTDEISALEVLVSGQLTKLFGGGWAEPRLQSCTYANAAVYAAFSAPGDTIATISAQEGGHVSHHQEGTVGLLGRRNLSLAFSHGIYDDKASAKIITRERPRIVMLGASVMLDPYTVDATISAARDCGALLVYDASHVAGLIAGKAYQNPMDMGFDIMTASTYKTLAGPPGGILIGRHQNHHDALRRHIVGGWASNYDASRLAGLSVALEEAAAFMPEYARKMLATAQELAAALKREGIAAIGSAMPGDVPPSSHHIIIPVSSAEAARRFSQQAGQAGLYVGTASVPGQPAAGGLRIGTQVISRQGATGQDIAGIAACFRHLLDDRPADMEQLLSAIASRLRACLYCFNPA
jgi:glycine hydroxymethyltransferase